MVAFPIKKTWLVNVVQVWWGNNELIRTKNWTLKRAVREAIMAWKSLDHQPTVVEIIFQCLERPPWYFHPNSVRFLIVSCLNERWLGCRSEIVLPRMTCCEKLTGSQSYNEFHQINCTRKTHLKLHSLEFVRNLLAAVKSYQFENPRCCWNFFFKYQQQNAQFVMLLYCSWPIIFHSKYHYLIGTQGQRMFCSQNTHHRKVAEEFEQNFHDESQSSLKVKCWNKIYIDTKLYLQNHTY